MIGYLRGNILTKRERTIVITVDNVGYEVYVPSTFTEKINLGDAIELYIHTNVREDDISLFGVSTEREMRLFRLLISVSGVGPRTALEMLNASVEDIQNAIAHKDTGFLTRLPGIGKKTAERICVDLSTKIMELGPAALNYKTVNHPNDELINALIALGYKRSHVVQGLKKIPQEITNEEAIIKYFLQHSL